MQSAAAPPVQTSHDATDATVLKLSLQDVHSPVADENESGTYPTEQTASEHCPTDGPVQLPHDATDDTPLNASSHDVHSPVADENDPGTQPLAQVAEVQSFTDGPVQLSHDVTESTESKVALQDVHSPAEYVLGTKPTAQVALLHSAGLAPVHCVHELYSTESIESWFVQHTPLAEVVAQAVHDPEPKEPMLCPAAQVADKQCSGWSPPGHDVHDPSSTDGTVEKSLQQAPSVDVNAHGLQAPLS